PTIEEVRLEGDGLTVVAGRAAPGAQVAVLVDGEEIATTVAGARGRFAAVGYVAPSDAARVLTLLAQINGETTASDADVIVAPVAALVAEAAPATGDDPVATQPDETPDAPQLDARVVADAPLEDPAPAAEQRAQTRVAPSAPAIAAPAAPTVRLPDVDETTQPLPEPPIAARDDTPEPTTAQVELQPAAPPTPAPTPAPAPQNDTPAPSVQASQDPPQPTAAPQPVAILRSTSDGVALLQTAPQPSETVAIDTIGYSAQGDVQLSGRAAAGTSEVRVYLQNRFTAAFAVDSDGAWRGDIPGIDAGLYQLRVDEVNGAGDVTSRIETPFKREAPTVLAEANAGQNGPVQAVTVQTGDTLWAIARDRYGEGVLFVKVFEANRGDIRDPDLIYPGQVFDLPIE
ncbi:LysM peptidoglycan-binding domain-containing protein, partial [Roseobacter sp.]